MPHSYVIGNMKFYGVEDSDILTHHWECDYNSVHVCMIIFFLSLIASIGICDAYLLSNHHEYCFLSQKEKIGQKEIKAGTGHIIDSIAGGF